jgi:hypothetical protein
MFGSMANAKMHLPTLSGDVRFYGECVSLFDARLSPHAYGGLDGRRLVPQFALQRLVYLHSS